MDDACWFRRRNYLHFDSPVSFKKAEKLVTNPQTVSRHSFYPLISYTIDSTKISKDKVTNQITKEPKKRPISYPAHKDGHIYSYYSKLISQHYEEKVNTVQLSESILAFRQLGKSNISFAKEAFDTIKEMGNCSVVALDIKSFFDTLDHKMLKEKWSKIISASSLPADHYSIYKSITQYSIVDKHRLYEELGISKNNPKKSRHRLCLPNEFRETVRKKGLVATNRAGKGIPQGTPISALLSNIYMIDFDILMNEVVSEQGGKYFRYCDDMLFITPTAYRDDVAGFVQSEIIKLGLSIQTKKTERRTFSITPTGLQSDKPLQYLGFTFDGERILIRSSSLSRYSRKMKGGVKLAKKTMEKKNKERTEKNLPEKGIYKKNLYERYSHLGKTNFITYGHRAAKEMNSFHIKRQLSPLWKRLKDEIEK
ncbi:antiviral reverse transcriptase Drt2 [Halomonas sp. RT37]|uniref:Reverse transcriptase/maturase family protein n=1 Tax=Halomonas sp. RT37 TaxID=2950872 RepID=A0AAU7KFP1_9GAMM